jgi:hypothetical protein
MAVLSTFSLHSACDCTVSYVLCNVCPFHKLLFLVYTITDFIVGNLSLRSIIKFSNCKKKGEFFPKRN